MAQGEIPGGARLHQLYNQAEDLLNQFKNDSAYWVATEILEELAKREALDSDFALKVQLVEAIALEQDQNDTIALKKLQQVKELSRKKDMWKEYTRASLTLANLFEKLGIVEPAFRNLMDAKVAVEKHQLDTLYAVFAIRSASYNRQFGDKNLALFYAKEVLRKSEQYGLVREEATGHLLMGLLHYKTDFEKAKYHFLRAGKLYVQLEDYVGCSFIKSNLCRLYKANGQPQVALSYNDSMITAAKKGLEMGYEDQYVLASAYKSRAELYRSLGEPDSAWIYIYKALDYERKYYVTTMDEKVLELEAIFDNEVKEQLINEQAQQIRLEKEKSFLLVGIFIVVILFAALLAFYTFKLNNVNQKIRQQAAQLKNLDQAKSRFFANISHELRTPLTLLLGPIRSLQQERDLTGKQAALLSLADRNGQQLQQLVDDILDLRKLEMGKMQIHPEPTVLSSFFNRHISQFESLGDRKEIDFSCKISLESDQMANIDKEKFRQILYNLLSNAFKFTPEGGSIGTKVWLEQKELFLRVTDSGPGIHPEDLPHLFDRYFQTKRPDKPAEGGTGIGLALCKEYTELMGGKIEAESTYGKGTTFKVILPVTLLDGRVEPTEDERQKNDDGPQMTSENLAYSVTSTITPQRSTNQPLNANDPAGRLVISNSRPTILVVEDNPDLQDYIRMVLSVKYEVVTADNGQQALEYLGIHTPPPGPLEGKGYTRQTDKPTFSKALAHPGTSARAGNIRLILSDLMMPVMDGYQLLEELKNNDATRHIPVVMLTARADLQDKLKALRVGVDDYLLKPFDEEELLVRIENLLTNQASRREAKDREQSADETGEVLSAEDQQWLTSFEAYVQQHFSDDLLSVPLLADQFAMSESTLLRQLKRLTGLTPNQYLQEIRLSEARRLLENKVYKSVSQVATEVGYGDSRSFSRRFKKRFGKLPSEL